MKDREWMNEWTCWNWLMLRMREVPQSPERTTKKDNRHKSVCKSLRVEMWNHLVCFSLTCPDMWAHAEMSYLEQTFYLHILIQCCHGYQHITMVLFHEHDNQNARQPMGKYLKRLSLPLFYFWALLVTWLTRRYQYWCCCHKHIRNSCLFLRPLINWNVVKQQIIFTRQGSQSCYVNPNYTVWSCSLVKYFFCQELLICKPLLYSSFFFNYPSIFIAQECQSSKLQQVIPQHLFLIQWNTRLPEPKW